MLKPYMGYSRELGSCEAAFLIFAHNIKEAKRIGYPALSGVITDEYTDMAVEWMKDSDFLFEQVPQWAKDRIAEDEAFVMDNPPSCNGCNLWGYELNDDGYCEDCASELAPSTEEGEQGE